MLKAMNKCSLLDNIKLPRTASDIALCKKGWTDISIRKFGEDIIPELFLTGDGLVIKIQAPTKKNLTELGLPLSNFRNRKNCFGLIVSGFCDAYTRIRVWECKWPGSTNDIVAYKTSNLYNLVVTQKIYDDYDLHFNLDEAYSSINDDKHLTPYSGHQLAAARVLPNGELEANKMLCYNNRHSGQRITIERCFGQYHRRFGIFWRPLAYKVNICILITFVCAKLHNLCVDAWLASRGIDTNMETGEGGDEVVVPGGEHEGMFGIVGGAEQPLQLDIQLPDDKSIKENNNNDPISDDEEPSPRASPRRLQPKRERLKDRLFSLGYFYERKTDN